MHRHRDAGRVDGVGQAGDVVLVRVHPARRDEPHEMSRPAALVEPREETLERRAAGQVPAFRRGVDAGQILGHDAPGAEVHVADLRVAHLAGRQADLLFGGLDQGIRAGGVKALERRRLGHADRVVLAALPVAPAVQDAKHHGAHSTVLAHAALYRLFAPDSTALSPPFPGAFAGRREVAPPSRQPGLVNAPARWLQDVGRAGSPGPEMSGAD